MKTPQSYTDNLKKGIITKAMLEDCLFSCNKRAKNMRDQERSYRQYRYDKYNSEWKYRKKKLDYYNKKEKLLSIVKPNCIHIEPYKKRTRIYEYENGYYENQKNAIYSNHYYDYELEQEIYFIDVLVPAKRYYLFYDFGEHSFHTPIEENDLGKYELEYITIDELVTRGKEITDLISTQFVEKVLELIATEKYILEMV